jgi:pimeloyl-ACP methyl ester carboxylesterase
MTKAILTSNIEIEYDTFGNKNNEPLLLIMGLGTQMIAWRDEFCEQLAQQGFFVIRFDNRDIGLSSFLNHLPSPNPFTFFKVSVLNQRDQAAYYLKDMAEDAIGLLDYLGIKQAHVCGASMGGMIAQEMAIHFSERVLSMCLIMTSPGDRRLPNPSVKVLLSSLRQMASLKGQHTHQRARHLKVIGSVGKLAPSFEDLLAHSKRLAKRAPDKPGSTRQVLAILSSPNRSKWLKQLNLPTLIIHGEADPLMKVEHAHALKALMPHARLELVKEMGHDIPKPLYTTFAKMIAELAESPCHSKGA